MPRVKSIPKKTSDVEGETIVSKARKFSKKVDDNIPVVVKDKVKSIAKDKAVEVADKALDRLRNNATKMIEKYSGNVPYGKELLNHIDKYSRKKVREAAKMTKSDKL